MKLAIRPLTRDLWPALEHLFGSRGACNGCWCMYWPIGSTYRKQPSDANRAAFRQIVQQEPPPGLLAFDGDLPVGWCQLTPRDSLPWLNRAWRLKSIDDLPVLAISCLFVRKGYRRKGITSALIQAAVETAKAAGALAVEAYPLDANLTASGTGYASTFARAGFKEVVRHTPPRPIMRFDLDRSSIWGMTDGTSRQPKEPCKSQNDPAKKSWSKKDYMDGGQRQPARPPD